MNTYRYAIRHRSTYTYKDPVVTSHHAMLLRPRKTSQQHVERFRMYGDPTPNHYTEEFDYFGNRRARFAFWHPYKNVTLTAASVISVQDSFVDPNGSAAWDEQSKNDDPSLIEWQVPSNHVPVGPHFADLARPFFGPGTPVGSGALTLAQHIQKEFVYAPGTTDVATPAEEVLQKRNGVCQDFSHVMLAAMRSLGIGCRYVSGYLETLPPPGRKRLQGADASHAWVSVHDRRLGWIDVDPTNGCMVSHQHITVAWGRDYADVSPITGVVLGGGPHRVRVGVDVIPESEWQDQGIDGKGRFSDDNTTPLA